MSRAGITNAWKFGFQFTFGALAALFIVFMLLPGLFYILLLLSIGSISVTTG